MPPEYTLVPRNAMCFVFSWRPLCPNGRCVERGENWFPWPFGTAWRCSPAVRHRSENLVVVRQGCLLLALPAGLVITSLVMKTILVRSERKAQNESLECCQIGFVKHWQCDPFMKELSKDPLCDNTRIQSLVTAHAGTCVDGILLYAVLWNTTGVEAWWELGSGSQWSVQVSGRPRGGRTSPDMLLNLHICVLLPQHNTCHSFSSEKQGVSSCPKEYRIRYAPWLGSLEKLLQGAICRIHTAEKR